MTEVFAVIAIVCFCLYLADVVGFLVGKFRE